MDNLKAIPHEDGLEILKLKLFNTITKFALVDDSDMVYHSSDVHSVYFDANKVLTIIVIIPKEEHFSSWNKYVRILSFDDKIIADIETPAIQFVSGIGGTQEIKLAVSGDSAGEIIFKKDDYVVYPEFEIFTKSINSLLSEKRDKEDSYSKEEIDNIANNKASKEELKGIETISEIKGDLMGSEIYLSAKKNGKWDDIGYIDIYGAGKPYISAYIDNTNVNNTGSNHISAKDYGYDQVFLDVPDVSYVLSNPHLASCDSGDIKLEVVELDGGILVTFYNASGTDTVSKQPFTFIVQA